MLLDCFVGLLADEFQRDVQGFRLGPAGVGCKSGDAFHESCDAVADGVGNVESDEEAHESAIGS